MSKRRSPHKRKTKPRLNSLNNAHTSHASNPVAKHARKVCTGAGLMRDQKQALKKGYRKHKGLEYMLKQFIARLFKHVLFNRALT